MQKDDTVYLRHIADAIARIDEFITGVSDGDFRSRRIVQSAVVRELEVIGEAARNLSDEFRRTHSQVEWPVVIAMRNRLIHAYFDVDLNIVLEVVRNDLPRLDAFIRTILD